ncbi:hypothetical protein B0J14DRAFT_702624 [Halenospora varia]|nr:hypothetical protein B0J14DRAFT_702624 [Halenospora varia]
MVRIPAAHLSSASLFLSTANHPDPVQHKHISTHYSQDTTHLHHLPPQIQLAHNLSLYATDLALTPPPTTPPSQWGCKKGFIPHCCTFPWLEDHSTMGAECEFIGNNPHPGAKWVPGMWSNWGWYSSVPECLGLAPDHDESDSLLNKLTPDKLLNLAKGKKEEANVNHRYGGKTRWETSGEGHGDGEGGIRFVVRGSGEFS